MYRHKDENLLTLTVGVLTIIILLADSSHAEMMPPWLRPTLSTAGAEHASELYKDPRDIGILIRSQRIDACASQRKFLVNTSKLPVGHDQGSTAHPDPARAEGIPASGTPLVLRTPVEPWTRWNVEERNG